MSFSKRSLTKIGKDGLPRDADGFVDQEALYEMELHRQAKRNTIAKRGLEPYLGEISWVGFTFCPQGWTRANGQLLSIQQNTALFSLLGTTYGGDGITNFQLPQLTTYRPDCIYTCIALEGIYPTRS
ncbi:receptor-binding domain of short tail fiber protein gp12 [Meredithblackwellia eburnea MCA 4105]